MKLVVSIELNTRGPKIKYYSSKLSLLSRDQHQIDVLSTDCLELVALPGTKGP